MCASLLLVLLAVGGHAGGPMEHGVRGASHPEGFDAIARPFLDAHCVRCHGAKRAESGLDLTEASAGGPAADPDEWDWLLERVVAGDMPPPGAGEPPTEAEVATFVDWLRGELQPSDAVNLPLPRVPLRRLTREQYERAISGLFGVDLDAGQYLPEDAVSHGFDHVAEAQTLSDVQFAGFLEAAEAVARRAVPSLRDRGPRVRRFQGSQIQAQGHHGGSAWQYSNGTAAAPVEFLFTGEYRIRAEMHGTQAEPDPCRVRLVLGEERSAVFDLTAGRDGAQVLEATLRLPVAGRRGVGFEFLNDFYRKLEDGKLDRNVAARWVEVEGPLGDAEPVPAFRDGVVAELGLDATDEAWARWVRTQADLAWRVDEVSDEDVRRLLALGDVRAGDSLEDRFDARLKGVLLGLVASPRFLFITEAAGRGAGGTGGHVAARGARPLAGREMATRLALFLWGEVPDRDLIALADAGELDNADDLQRVARRMIADERADRFVRSFSEQWMQLRPLEDRPRGQRALGGKLRDALLEESFLVLRDSLRSQRDLRDLIRGTHTFVNGDLAEHYGMEIEGADWQRVDTEGTPRRGLLGHGSVLAVTSESQRTSPVRRGKWVLDVLLGSAPPPPPPGADSLPDALESDPDETLRERLERHRSDPTCASCHVRMDPLGFGMETFGPAGAVRGTDELDLAGVLPDGRSFEGPVELAALLADDPRFLETFVERVFVYGMGRGATRADRPTLGRLVDSLDADRPTMEQVLLGVVGCFEFRHVTASADGGTKEGQ